ncbi:Protease inhibitor Inh [Pseudomonas amygdali pv. morsprunorum]|uniref:hypothetical protein n=1 Tax=Pseudomonas amygdali TaxID=47877 RepID=UPI0006B99C31|nr:hypothetical protein [Pseudomonas amygdali]KPC58069.1 Protease inhibitor Inh [Pseudomonas amygdali pv. morsprunorum]PPS34241.1 hypothetical protein BVY10_04170 [Pseudomonas amygdali pv. morsprunorum]
MKINHVVRIVPVAFALLVGISGASMAMSLKLPDPAHLNNMGEQIYQARLPGGEVLVLGRLAD